MNFCSLVFFCSLIVYEIQKSRGDIFQCLIGPMSCSCIYYYNPDQQEYLDISCSQISAVNEIPSNDLIHFASNLTETINRIYITYKQITVVRSRSFLGLSTKELDLSNNMIEEIEANAFLGLDNLESITLTKNAIKILHYGSFVGLSRVTTLDLSQQKLSKLEKGVFVGLDNLMSLYLNLNQIQVLEEGSLMGLSSVDDFKMISNNLQVIKSNAFLNMTSLQSLDFKEYGLTTLESMAFRGLSNLTKLYLESNFLTRLVNFTFFGLDRLSNLSLKDNKIERIEQYAFQGLFSLSVLDLSSNSLIELDSWVFIDLVKVRLLNLSLNSINVLNRNALYGLGRSLETLDASENRLDKINNYDFQDLRNLKTLTLSSNLISSIEDSSFDNLKGVRRLYLNNNCLFKLNQKLFYFMDNLEVIDLNDNTLIWFSLYSLYDLWLLKELGLSKSYLTYFDWNAVTDLSSLDLSSSLLLRTIDLKKSLVSLRLDNSISTELVIKSSDDKPFPNLNYLYLRNFPKAARVNFNLLSNLSDLDLSFDEISNLTYFFEKQKYNSLRTLWLRGARFNFSLRLLTNFPNLLKLDIGEAKFILNTTLSGKLKTLATLYLDNLGIESDFVKKNFNFFNMNKLTNLDVSNNRLEYFPVETYADSLVLSGIKSLNLRNNFIKVFNFDFTLSDMQLRIEMLDLGQNKLSNISLVKGKAAFVSLAPIIICLDNNNFDFNNVYPGFFYSISSARQIIDLSFNQLTVDKLDEISGSRMKYTHLNLSHNQLTSFSFINSKTAFSSKSVLKYIDLSVNRIETIDAYTLRSLYSLGFLNISHNQLTSLDESMFQNLRSLKTLDINTNLLTILPARIFEPLSFLRYLNLSSNRINSTCLTPELFVSQANLIDLDLSNNSIDYIDPYLFQRANSLKNLYINSNPIKILEHLFGLDSIENIYASCDLLGDDSNTINLNKSITPHLVKTGPFSSYFKSTYVNMIKEHVYDDKYCERILFLLKEMILLNLKDQAGLQKFMIDCDQFSKRLFQPESLASLEIMLL